MYGDTHLYIRNKQVENKLNDPMLLKTVWAICFLIMCCLCMFLYLQYHLVWTLCVACDQDLGLPRFVNEVKVNGKVFTQ